MAVKRGRKPKPQPKGRYAIEFRDNEGSDPVEVYSSNDAEAAREALSMINDAMSESMTPGSFKLVHRDFRSELDDDEDELAGELEF